MILASNSASRRAMLDAAGIAYTRQAADVDERAIEAGMGQIPPADIALGLAKAKALDVSARNPGELVLGSDSLVVCDGRRFDKPADRAQAAEHLRYFSGKVMGLHSAAALAMDGHVVWGEADCADLHTTMMTDAFIEAYLDAEWPHVAGCVGVFRIEARGVTLFDRIEGDYFTILGMPLFKVLQALRQFGVLAR